MAKTRAKKHSPKKAYVLQIVRGLLAMVLVGALGYGVWHTTRLSSVTIDTVVVTGGDTINPAVIEDVIKSELEGTYAALIPRTFTYLYPAAAIKTSVAAIPRVKDITLTRTDRNTITLAFTEYRPFALWCDEFRVNCLLINEAGYAFSDAPQLSGGALIRIVVEDRPLVLRQTAIAADVLEQATAFAAQLEQEFGFIAREFYYQQNGDLTISLVGGAELRTNASDAIETVFNNLETVLGSENFLHLRADNFQYIDLRFGNKVFVNEEETKEAAGPETSSSTATST